MNWLARLEVEAETVRAAGIAEDVYAWHKMLWDCYPNQPDAKRDFLTRIDQLEGAFRFWVLAKRKPARPQWCPATSFSLNQISPSFLSHQYYAFDLRANPVKAMVQRDASGVSLRGTDGKWKRGKRMPLVKPDELREWLKSKGEVRCRDAGTGLDVPGGFRIFEGRPLEISPMVESHFRKKGKAGYHGGVQFRGTLEGTDREKFMQTCQSGIGSAKGFGFGLLLLAPVNL